MVAWYQALTNYPAWLDWNVTRNNMKLPYPHDKTYHKEFMEFDDFYAAYYCKKCDFWLEDKCEDPLCLFCKQRPEKPSKVFYSQCLDR